MKCDLACDMIEYRVTSSESRGERTHVVPERLVPGNRDRNIIGDTEKTQII